MTKKNILAAPPTLKISMKLETLIFENMKQEGRKLTLVS